MVCFSSQVKTEHKHTSLIVFRKKLKLILQKSVGATEMWDIKDPTFSGKLTHRWPWGCQPCALAALYPKRHLVLIYFRGWVYPRVILHLKVLCKLKTPINLSENGPSNFQLVSSLKNQNLHSQSQQLLVLHNMNGRYMIMHLNKRKYERPLFWIQFQ